MNEKATAPITSKYEKKRETEVTETAPSPKLPSVKAAKDVNTISMVIKTMNALLPFGFRSPS
jgi:hypothetical protein